VLENRRAGVEEWSASLRDSDDGASRSLRGGKVLLEQNARPRWDREWWAVQNPLSLWWSNRFRA